MSPDLNCEDCDGRGWRNVGGCFETCLCVLKQRVKAPREHHSTEAVKRLIIAAMVNNDNGVGMAASARIAADQIIDLLVPNANHKHMPIPCTCLSELASDAYGPGGPMSGKPMPICLKHPRQTCPVPGRRGCSLRPDGTCPALNCPAPKPAEDPRPINCTQRLQDDGNPHPKSGCAVCGSRLGGCPYEQRT